MPRQALPITLCALLAASACHLRGEDSAAPNTPAAVVLEVHPPSPVVAEAQALANSLQARQLTLAADLRAGIDARDALTTGAALAELGRSLAEMRGSTFDGSLVEALRWFASAEMAELRSVVDARRVIPALEVLLDVRDGAAVHRLRDSYRAGPGAERFQAAFSLSLSWTNATSSLTYTELGCPLLIDGAPASESPVGLTYGSHTVGCQGGAVFLFVADSLSHGLSLENGELRVVP